LEDVRRETCGKRQMVKQRFAFHA